ncbi:MAG: hypothetical protein B6245_09995 [Desulfobacteraceae bacterium 4572_88]|nr:MAG: hypothetical protein B6245_09995 [Desulfobacteraceae bacterium 4572_88]
MRVSMLEIRTSPTVKSALTKEHLHSEDGKKPFEKVIRIVIPGMSVSENSLVSRIHPQRERTG